jgi:hypothetical protein
MDIINNDGYAKSPYAAKQFSQGGFCLGYISAIIEFNGATICAPSTATYEQAIRITFKYLNNNPERLSLPANLLVFAAMSSAFPCQAK